MAIQFNPEYLKKASEKSVIKKIKEYSYSLMNLQVGMKALDIGCGPGIDTLQLAKIVGNNGVICGIDADKSMIDLAKNKTEVAGYDSFVFHRLAQATNLPFDSNYFDSTRCERVLQHLSIDEAKATVQEAIRVTKPDGNIVFLDTDWTSLSIHCNNPNLERKIINIICFAIKNGFAARALPELFYISKVESVAFETRVLLLPFIDIKNLIEPIILEYIKVGWVNQFDFNSFLCSLNDLNEKGMFYASLNIIICNGRKAK
jgi:ubiquinone/menaquinone biosynthesis C-methylase UbiE